VKRTIRGARGFVHDVPRTLSSGANCQARKILFARFFKYLAPPAAQ
jgi:hypothetical protein